MSDKFDVKVFNSSDKTIDFQIVNSKCVYVPKSGMVATPPGTWAVFEGLEINNNVLTFCNFCSSVFQIVGNYNGQILGSTKYEVYVDNRSYHWYSTWSILNSEGVRACGFKPEIGFHTNAIIFERVESYGDLFFTGRDLFLDNSCKAKAWQIAETVVEQEGLKTDGYYPPSLLVNSIKTLDTNRNDFEFRNIVSNMAEVATLGAKLWGDAKPSSSTSVDLKQSAEKGLVDNIKQNWKPLLSEFGKMLSDYYAGYSVFLQKEREITITISNVDVKPSFHVVFTDSLLNKAMITSGKFEMPEPPDNHDTFYASVRRGNFVNL